MMTRRSWGPTMPQPWATVTAVCRLSPEGMGQGQGPAATEGAILTLTCIDGKIEAGQNLSAMPGSGRPSVSLNLGFLVYKTRDQRSKEKLGAWVGVLHIPFFWPRHAARGTLVP